MKRYIKRTVFLTIMIIYLNGFGQKVKEMDMTMIDTFELRVDNLKKNNYYCFNNENVFFEDLISTREDLVQFVKMVAKLKFRKKVNFNDYTFIIGEHKSKKIWMVYIFNHKVSFVGNGTYLAVFKNNSSILFSESIK